jgi:arylsulfatase A-like enzyme
LWAAPLSFALLLARGTIALGRPLGAAEQLYLAGQALRMGLCAGALLCVLAWVDERTKGRLALGVAAGLLALCAPKAWHGAHYLSVSDAVVRRGISSAQCMAVSLVVLTGLVLLTWLYQRAASPSRTFHLLAVLVLSFVLVLDATIGFSQSGLVPFWYGVAAVILTVLLDSLVARGSRLALRIAVVSSATLACAGLLGLALPAYAARGRADLHRTRSSLAHLDMHLTQRDSGPSLFEALGVTPESTCDVPAHDPNLLGLSASQRKNVIIVSIDSVRVDDMTARPGGRLVMPELERFMKESWAAPRAYSAYPATLMSLSTTFSGLLPSSLMMQSPAPPSVVGSALRETHERVLVLPRGSYFQRAPIEQYIAQGAQRITPRGAAEQTRAAITKLQELRTQGKPHVLWIHYLEPHEPYESHPDFDFGSSTRGRYRSELAFVDHELGKLLSFLREGGWYDDSLIFVLSDHGEAFGEHGQEFHHFQLYPWLIQVPFALHVPQQPARTLDGPVQLTDLAATTLEFVGARSRLPLDGRSLLSDPPRADRVILSEEFPATLSTLTRYGSAHPAGREEAQRRALELEDPSGYPSKVSVIQREHQLILHRGTGVMELYDLVRDPGARNNLAYTDRQQTRALQDALTGWFNEVARRTSCPNAALTAAQP